MILGSKHVGAILNVLMYKQFYVCALVGVLIKCLYEMHGATIKIAIDLLKIRAVMCRVRHSNNLRFLDGLTPLLKAGKCLPIDTVQHLRRLQLNRHHRENLKSRLEI
jgi:hypothetical protein